MKSSAIPTGDQTSTWSAIIWLTGPALEQSSNWDQATASNDVNRVRAFMTDDWIRVSANGIMAFEDFIRQIQHGN